jgi:hypothetical protein
MNNAKIFGLILIIIASFIGGAMVQAGTICAATPVIHEGAKWEIVPMQNGPELIRYQVSNGWLYATQNNWTNIAFVPSG